MEQLRAWLLSRGHLCDAPGQVDMALVCCAVLQAANACRKPADVLRHPSTPKHELLLEAVPGCAPPPHILRQAMNDALGRRLLLQGDQLHANRLGMAYLGWVLQPTLRSLFAAEQPLAQQEWTFEQFVGACGAEDDLAAVQTAAKGTGAKPAAAPADGSRGWNVAGIQQA
jgi:hypothetical protein